MNIGSRVRYVGPLPNGSDWDRNTLGTVLDGPIGTELASSWFIVWDSDESTPGWMYESSLDGLECFLTEHRAT